MLSDHYLGAALVEICRDGVAVEGYIGDPAAEDQPINQWRHADRVIAMAGQKNKAHEIAQRIGQRED